MKNILCALLLLCLFSSCIITNTPGFYSGYKDLSNDEKEKVLFVRPEVNICDRVNDSFVYAINGKQLLSCLAENDTSVVYFWSAHCSSDMCVTMQAAQRYCDKMNYKLYVVAEYYDMDIIRKQHTIPSALYIPNHKYYKANYCDKYVKRFKNDLLKAAKLPKDQRYGRFMFFKDGRALFAKNRLIPATPH